MERKNLLFLSSSLVITSAFIVASCTSDDDFLMEKGLDINSQVPLTRSDDGGSGASQDLNADPSAKYNVPIEDNECAWWAAVQMAINNRIDVNTGKTDKRGKPIKRKIGSAYGPDNKTYTAADAYNDIKNIARSKDRNNHDYMGNETTGTHRYTDGEVFPADLADVTSEAGIMEGEMEFFENFGELTHTLNSEAWKSKHSKGTYMLYNPRETRNKGHFSICNGTKINKQTNQLEINCKDSGGNRTYTNSDDNYPNGIDENDKATRKGWIIIY